MKLKKIIDVSLLGYLILFYTLAVIISVARKVYWKLISDSYPSYQSMSWSDLLTYNILLDWVTVISFMIMISYLTQKMFDRDLGWKKIIVVHLFFSFLIGYFIFFISGLASVIIENYPWERLVRNLSLDHFMAVVHLNFLTYASMIGIITIYYYIKKVKNIELQKSQLQMQLATTKLNMLRSQLHPHFMFNTLNSISSMMEIDTEKSQNLIADFGDLFRELIANNDKNMIPLSKELELLEKYVDIVSVRFSDHLRVQKNIEDGLEDCLIPSMIIQPMIENAVKHGYSYDKTELEIELSIFKEFDRLCIMVKNNGAPLQSDFNDLLDAGTGLKTTYERLKTLFKEDFVFDLKNELDQSGVMAIIKIPCTLKL